MSFDFLVSLRPPSFTAAWCRQKGRSNYKTITLRVCGAMAIDQLAFRAPQVALSAKPRKHKLLRRASQGSQGLGSEPMASLSRAALLLSPFTSNTQDVLPPYAVRVSPPHPLPFPAFPPFKTHHYLVVNPILRMSAFWNNRPCSGSYSRLCANPIPLRWL